MKTIEEIRQIKRLTIGKESFDGFSGMIQLPRWQGTIIGSWGGGWEHISVSPFRKSLIPLWEDMTMLKDLFFYEDEAVIQVHPPKAEYVNFMPNCLHLWRCKYKPMVLPPSCFVGLKKGQTMSELEAEIKQAYAEAGEEY